ncbi:MAG: hypothetical protein H6634_16425 [Anaerolineales bacterium]|nr:hypothetical protein [Anaerolineales bacterium]
MAKIRKNIIIQGFSGTLGDQLIIKQDKAGRTILAVPPTFSENRTFSEAQQAQHEKFREASTYAKDAKSEEIYQEKAEGTPQTPYNVAMADWFHAPEVKEIDLSGWNGGANEVIRIRAVDDVEVAQVTVLITDGGGAVLEQGSAANVGSGWWHYTTEGDTSGASRIVASARDLPGNVAQLEWLD